MHCDGLGAGEANRHGRFDLKNAPQALIRKPHLQLAGAGSIPVAGQSMILCQFLSNRWLGNRSRGYHPRNRFSLQHINVEYGPVHFPRSKIEIWLPF